MKVKDLIEQLKLEDSEATILVWDAFHDKATETVYVNQQRLRVGSHHIHNDVIISNYNFNA
jgi:hypothetical protein